jgi:hypothetical protein
VSQFGTITCTYRAEVQVPMAVFQKYGHTPEYAAVAYAGGSIVAHTGQDSYHAGVIEWGESPTRRECEDFIGYWHNRILQWQAQL